MTKPPVLTAEQITTQLQELHQQKDSLSHHFFVIEHRLKSLELSLKENDHLRKQVTQLLQESMNLFEEEWKRKSEYYPDIHLQILLKAAEGFAAKK